jgi:hypothetical protein
MTASLTINQHVLSFMITQFFQVSEFVSFVDQQAQYYTSNNIILTMGGDFTYQDAEMYFKNLDKLIK